MVEGRAKRENVSFLEARLLQPTAQKHQASLTNLRLQQLGSRH
jgi:hypothetical protein